MFSGSFHEEKGCSPSILIAVLCFLSACVGFTEPDVADNASDRPETQTMHIASPTVSPYAAGYKQCDEDSCVVQVSDLPDVPERMMVYKLANRMTLENATAIARALKMNGTLSENDEIIFVDEEHRHLMIDNYQARVMYSDESEWTSPDPLSVPEPSPRRTRPPSWHVIS